jgi:hypothetical protein
VAKIQESRAAETPGEASTTLKKSSLNTMRSEQNITKRAAETP